MDIYFRVIWWIEFRAISSFLLYHDLFLQHPFVMSILIHVSVHICPILALLNLYHYGFDMHCPIALQKDCANWHSYQQWVLLYISQIWIALFLSFKKYFQFEKQRVFHCNLYSLTSCKVKHFTDLLYICIFFFSESSMSFAHFQSKSFLYLGLANIKYLYL